MDVIPECDECTLRITRILDPAGLRLEGELDATGHGDLAEALSELAAEGGDVRLDCAGLRFVDLGTLSLLTRFMERCGTGVRLVLDDLSPEVANLVDTVGWERLPGLTRGRKGMS